VGPVPPATATQTCRHELDTRCQGCFYGRLGPAIRKPTAGRPEQVERVEVQRFESGSTYDAVNASARVETPVAVAAVELAEESWVGGDEEAELASGTQGPRHRGDWAGVVLDGLQDVLAEDEVRLGLELGGPGRVGELLLEQPDTGVVAEAGLKYAGARGVGLNQHEPGRPRCAGAAR
jgi:hypothetical protein